MSSGSQNLPPRNVILATLAYAVAWLGAFVHWRFGPFLPESLSAAVHWIVFGLAVPITLTWVWWGTRPERRQNRVQVAAILSICLIFWWQFAVFATDAVGLYELRSSTASLGVWLVFFTGLAWVVW